ncbi:Leucine-rich repeat, partial [Arabidopsis suecica]
EKWRNNTDCCSWDGVSCDPKTGVVVVLDLEFNGLNGPLRSNSSLFRLQHLQILDLGSNNIWGTLPDSIGNLKYLRVLSFKDCHLYGKIPSSLGSLSYLTHLDLSFNEFTSEPPDSMGNLNRLTDMLLNLSSLIWIDLRSNKFRGILPSNMSSLSELKLFDISGNSFSGTIPSSLFMIPSLRTLYLGRNDFSGPFEIGNISSQSNLEDLNIGRNNFYPDIVDLSIFSPLLSLRYLDVSGINLKISSTVSLPSPIDALVLSSCNISEFPKFLRNQTRLFLLDISANQIEGQVPEWLWSLPELGFVNISHNSFNGFEGPADVIQGGGELYMLDISSNTFQDPFPLLPVVSMNYLFSSNNRFSGEIPKTICELDNLWILVLSNNNFSGSIPRCFENLHLYVLHLRNNNLSGIFPEEAISHRLQSFDVGHNLFSGELPKSLINCSALEFLNVEDNRINDTFPSWLELLPNLQILVLRSNEFHGPISSPGDSLSFPRLRIFDISENRFTGVLPSDYFAPWSAMSSVVDIKDRIIQDIVGSYQDLYYHNSVVLTNKGLNMELVGSDFTIYKTIDVSGNRLQGDIPESIGLLKELIVLNMSNNAFTGHIPPSLSNLSNLQSLDLSQNRLSGSIPGELGELTFLARMNFSYNRLEGPIPQTTQIQTQDSSSFTENPGLCGLPLKKNCGGKEEATKQEQDEEKEEEEQVFSWIAAAIGYVPGVVCGLTIGHILVSHKRDWFMRTVSLFT